MLENILITIISININLLSAWQSLLHKTILSDCDLHKLVHDFVCLYDLEFWKLQTHEFSLHEILR